MNICCIVFAVMYIYSQFLTVDDPDEHIGFHSNYISEKLGVKILHVFVQSGTDDEYWGALTFEQRVGHIFEDSPHPVSSRRSPFHRDNRFMFIVLPTWSI